MTRRGDADLVVVGGGPVGLATALAAARAGLVPVVVEPRPGPIDKACGEGLMPPAVAALRALGVDVPGRPFRGIRYLTGPDLDARDHRPGPAAVDGAPGVVALFRAEPGRGVRRTALHAALAGAVDRAGVEVVVDAMTSLEQDGVGVLVRLRRHGAPLRARYAVAADGLHSPTRRLLGLDADVRGPRRFGVRRHLRVAAWTDLVEVHWSRAAEAYVTTVADDLVGVAVLGSGQGSWEDRLAAFPDLRSRLADADGGDVRGAGPLRQRARARRVGRVLLAGDAAGYVDALTGEGIAVGVAQARSAVDAVVTDRPQDYPRAAARAARRSGLLTAGLVTATRTPTGRRVVLGAAHRLPRVFDLAVNSLARP